MFRSGIPESSRWAYCGELSEKRTFRAVRDYFRFGPSLDRDRRIVVSSSTLRGNAPHICCRRRPSRADGGPRSAGLLLPSLNVHARHEEPQHRQSFHEEGGGQTVPGQIVCERR